MLSGIVFNLGYFLASFTSNFTMTVLTFSIMGKLDLYLWAKNVTALIVFSWNWQRNDLYHSHAGRFFSF